MTFPVMFLIKAKALLMVTEKCLVVCLYLDRLDVMTFPEMKLVQDMMQLLRDNYLDRLQVTATFPETDRLVVTLTFPAMFQPQLVQILFKAMALFKATEKCLVVINLDRLDVMTFSEMKLVQLL